jgi:glycosyltransferase involved in cell wall biosynthesis
MVPGGVDTFIRGIVKFAPDDIAVSLVGMTTDPEARPKGRWTRCRLGSREFDFFPVVCVANAAGRSRIPLSLRYTAATALQMRHLRHGFDIFEFHRVEPALLFLSDPRPKNAFFHQDMAVIRTEKADIMWRHMPALYFSVERCVVRRLASAWCVRQEGVRALRERFPAKAGVIDFIPTWVDTDVFSPIAGPVRHLLRGRIADELRTSIESAWVISVGRLDIQKDPELLLTAIARVRAAGMNVCWLVVGDGVLRPSLERQVASLGLQDRVRFLGLKRPDEIAGLLRAADVFALSSAYEGMPMALLEALGSGLPVATTDVGEVRRVVQPGVNGSIATDRSEAAFAACLSEVIDRREHFRGAPAVAAVQNFRPARVLGAVYDRYRQLARCQPDRSG